MNQKINSQKEFQLKIFYKYKKIIIDELSLDLTKASFGDIVNHFKNNIKKKYPQFILKSKYFFNGKEIEEQNIISNLLTSQNIQLEQIKELNFEIFLDEIYNIYDIDLENFKKIIIPIVTNNSLELYIYFPSKGFIDIEEYDENIYKEYFLNKINSKTSFCNTINYLFLSGGEYQNEIIDNFWIINNGIYSIKTLKLPSPKSNHSMFLIDDNNIIIVGGNDMKVFIFNINNNEFSILENTNNTHFQPTLFLWDNYIYCFSEQNNSIIAEKLLFSDKKNKWENITLNLINENELLNNNTNTKNENILIILRGKKRLSYNPLNNNIIDINNDNFNFDFEICPNDKNNYKISKYYNVYIPDNFECEKKLIVLNKKNRIFHKMNFVSSDDTLKIKHQFEETEKIDNENNIIVKLEFENFFFTENISFNNFDEEKNDIDMNNNEIEDKEFEFKGVLKSLKSENEIPEKNLENGDEKEIIREVFTFKDNNLDIDYKSHPSKNNLLIPNNIAYEQLIHRTSDINENEEDEINIYDISNDNDDNNDIKEKIVNPKKHNLSSDININNENNENIIYDELLVENKNDENNQKEKIVKPKINLLLSKESLDEHLINREIINDEILQNLNDDNKNDSIINPVKRKLESMEIKENNDDNIDNSGNNEEKDKPFDDVFSFDAFELDENENDKKDEDEVKTSNILKNKVNLFLPQNSLEDQLIDRKIDLEGINDDKEVEKK